MAFTGSATIKMITDREVRITGLALAGAASGTIGLFPKTAAPDVRLPEAFQPMPYVGPDGTTVSLQDSISFTLTIAQLGVTTAVPIAVVKTGTTPEDFVATLTNTTAATLSANQEIMVRFHD